MTRLILRPAAEADIVGAETWYSKRDSALGIRFIDELRTTLRRVREIPRQFPDVGGARRALRSSPCGGRPTQRRVLPTRWRISNARSAVIASCASSQRSARPGTDRGVTRCVPGPGHLSCIRRATRAGSAHPPILSLLIAAKNRVCGPHYPVRRKGGRADAGHVLTWGALPLVVAWVPIKARIGRRIAVVEHLSLARFVRHRRRAAKNARHDAVAIGLRDSGDVLVGAAFRLVVCRV